MANEEIRTRETCEVWYLNEEKVRALEGHLLENGQVESLAAVFTALAEPNRLRILDILRREEVCVCDLAYLLNLKLPAVSQHLRILRQLGLVTFRKEGRIAYYSLREQAVTRILEAGLKHLQGPRSR